MMDAVNAQEYASNPTEFFGMPWRSVDGLSRLHGALLAAYGMTVATASLDAVFAAVLVAGAGPIFELSGLMQLSSPPPAATALSSNSVAVGSTWATQLPTTNESMIAISTSLMLPACLALDQAGLEVESLALTSLAAEPDRLD